MSSVHKQLHKLEKELIQINGLMEALQKILPDGSSHNCVANELEERLQHFERYFYEFWKVLSNG
jgi:hypothetical protein